MGRHISPLLETMRIPLDLSDIFPFVVPFEKEAASFGPGEDRGTRPFMVMFDDAVSRDAMQQASASLVRAFKAGLQIPSDLLEALIIRRSIGRVRFRLTETVTTFVVTRLFEPSDVYEALCLAVTNDFVGWQAINGRSPGDPGHVFPLIVPVSSPDTMADGGGASSSPAGGAA